MGQNAVGADAGGDGFIDGTAGSVEGRCGEFDECGYAAGDTGMGAAVAIAVCDPAAGSVLGVGVGPAGGALAAGASGAGAESDFARAA